jgi:hypothetical protein
MKQEKMYIKNSYNNKETAVTLWVHSYTNNNQLAILLYTPKWEYYSDLSVFVQPFEYQNYMAVDVNNLPTAEEFIQKYDLWELVDYVHSWFVSYPVYAMNMDELSKRDKKWVDELIKSEFKTDENSKTTLREKLK